MELHDVSRALVPVAGQERLVKRRFWEKIRRTLGKVPLTDRAIAAYYAAIDPATPTHVKGILFAALAYFVVPADLIPDFLPVGGFTDDATVLFTVFQTLAAHITNEHITRARRLLHKQAREAQDF